MIKQLINMPFLRLQQIEYSDSIIRIYASAKSRRSKCPSCGKYSSRVHDYYYRTITDLPVFQNRTVILLKTRKFKCGNKKCIQKVFSEQTPAIIRYSRRTKRASMILETFAIELTGRLGSMMSRKLYISVSSSTITRIAHRLDLTDINQPRVLGVDDWAYRKGISYGTILIDMETSRPIDLLPSRDGQVLKSWLQKYNDVKIVTRDRASSYASAIFEACPHAIQVADRFHLLMNLSDALDTYFKSISSKIRSVITTKTNKFQELSTLEPVNEKKSEERIPELNFNAPAMAVVDPRLETFNKVKKLQTQRIPIKRIATNLKMSRNTVRSYFSQDQLSPRSHPKKTNFDIFSNLILSRLQTNGYMLKDIYEEIKGQGFNGSRSQAYYNINALKQEYDINTLRYGQIPNPKIPYIRPLSSRKLSCYIGARFSDIIDPKEKYYMQIVLENITELQIVRRLVQLFKTFIARGKGKIRKWIDFVIRSRHKLSGLKTFAKGLLRDIDAVENGISLPWSNGAVEGHVNRIKSIKRQMYGRASFELLRKKVILSESG